VSRARGCGRAVLIAAGVVVLAAGLAILLSANVRFLLRAGYEEARILLRRRPIAALVADTSIAPARRAKLQLTLDARAFGRDSLGLNTGNTYTTFADVGRDTLVLVLSASPKNRLVPYLWHFPIVGAVPYHGYFSLAAARAAMRDLEARGFDTYLRPSGAFSTLGWFSDPLVSTALDADSTELVATVLHETAHATLYVPGATPFDEGFAQFVGYHGAAAFFDMVGDSARAREAEAIWHDERLLAVFYADLAARLDTLYASGRTGTALDAARAAIFTAARRTLVDSLGPEFQAYRAAWFARRPLNNASVIAARIYRTRLAAFDAVLDAQHGDVRAAIGAIVRAEKTRAGGEDPYTVLAGLAAQ